jgi:hypothetical protein
MAENVKHGRTVSPIFISNRDGERDDLHGITDIAADVSVATDDVFIVGQADKCATERDIPEATVPVTQLERGEIDSYLLLANRETTPAGGLRLIHFSAGLVDVGLYVREEERGDIEGTVWVPKTAINSLSLSVDADERLVRTFDLIGENRRTLAGANRHLIHKTSTAGSGVSGNYVIDVSDPAPEVNPHVSGEFILRVDRTRDGAVETITTWSYDDGAEEVTVTDAEEDDIYNVYYSAASFGSAGDPTSVDSDPQCFLKAENVKVLISDGTSEVEIDDLTSRSFGASITRLNEAKIGSTDKIKDITETPVSLTLSGRVNKDFQVEKAFMNSLADPNLVSDVVTFKENVRVTILIYDSPAKNTFLIGYQLRDLSFNDSSFSVSANEFATLDFGASTTDVRISKTIADFDLI